MSQAAILRKNVTKESKKSGKTEPMAWLLKGTEIQDSQ
jgi:hypothetical protein